MHKVSIFKTYCKLMMFQEAFCMFETSVNSVLLFLNIFFQYKMCTIPFKIGSRILILIN